MLTKKRLDTMATKCIKCIIVALIWCAILAYSFPQAVVYGWSNGGYSAHIEDPDYGTHDWIAQHALDWLPTEERQFITDSFTSFLYGTELPDNSQTPEGIGDANMHHIYFYVNGSLQDDSSAVRANMEYEKAKRFHAAGNFTAVLLHLGMVTHYIADMAVFGHVMGAATAWGTETHHSEYEYYVLDRTLTYSSGFDSYLRFDGSLASTTAYGAALRVARDTTFDGAAGLNCTWMDQHFNWSDEVFRNRCGESLNLAVNVVADMLHSFFAETVIPEFPSSLTFAALLVLALGVSVCVRKKVLEKKYDQKLCSLNLANNY
jgi:hypothetical protein